MRSLLNLLATGEGCDLVIICEGQFFFVHRAVVATHSPVLKSETAFSQFLGGEAYTLENVSPDAFRRILAFLYRGSISDHPRLFKTENNGILGTTPIELAKRFPNVNNFLATIGGGPGSVSKGDSTSTNLGSVTTEQKWAVLTSKQRLLNKPHDNSPCSSPTEVMAETEVYTAARMLQVVGLQDVALSKIMAWVEKELLKEAPLSEDLRLAADYMLRRERALVTPFLSLCTRYMPAVEQDATLVSLLTSLDPNTWQLLCSMRTQWTTENDQLKQDLLQQERRTRFLEASIKLNQSQEALFADELTSQIDKLGESLKASQENHKFAEAKIEGLNKNIQSQQNENLQLKAAKLGAKDANQPKPEPNSKVNEELRATNQKLRADLSSLRASQARLRDELENEKQLYQKLCTQYNESKSAIDRFRTAVNRNSSCNNCKRRWNIDIEHMGYNEIGIMCNGCWEMVWY
ncbi:hypothetical protein EDD36DRAFT_460546 [Exophiala viscosa]|uniref:BTB domain-containing protein n=1 Tax=Exophiala viscosa TaxID=2486360 RepID=A0AAN6IIN4_9EURO|nr:hypothetical protein EDD36DRAFT_460546 [Exophiala viscosa]